MPIRPLLVLSMATLAHAGHPGADFDWITIGAPGNRGANESELEDNHDEFLGFGVVGQPYRIARLEVSGRQWFEFIEAFAPYAAPYINTPAFLGGVANFAGFDQEGVPVFAARQHTMDGPIDVGWSFAARYVNWRHNDKDTSLESFERGAYDLPPIGTDPYDYPLTRNECARFWLPSIDEWVKAVYYDPDRYGPGHEGYWQFPDGGNEPLTPGPPGAPGAETSSDWEETYWGLPLGSYPHVQTPWGLHDASGGNDEWTETPPGRVPNWTRYIAGSDWRNGTLGSDRLDTWGAGSVNGGKGGIRLASAARPCPACAADLNADGVVNYTDLNSILLWFGLEAPIADATGDGIVDFADLNVVLVAFGDVCE